MSQALRPLHGMLGVCVSYLREIGVVLGDSTLRRFVGALRLVFFDFLSHLGQSKQSKVYLLIINPDAEAPFYTPLIWRALSHTLNRPIDTSHSQ